MARPINPTPILMGEDAKRFLQETEHVSYDSKKAKFLKECDLIYSEIKKDLH